MPAPFEIMAAPFEAYLAPVGESFPAIDETPAGNWVKIGTSGKKNINEEGVTVSHPQTIEYFRTVGSTGPCKAFRTEEDLMISFILHDMALEHYKDILNHNTVTDNAEGSGVAGFREVDIWRGLDVSQKALLLKAAASAYGANFNSQYEVPVVVQASEPEIVFTKGEPAGLLFEFRALEDPNAASDAKKFGTLNIQDAAAT